ncbi:hypothetical protein BJX64DRAFT_293471 [Aspergillus heterothallicus]
MHPILSLTLLTLTSTTALAQSQSPSVEDLVKDFLPECVHSCALDILESSTECSLDDLQCVCNSNVTTYNLLNEWWQCPGTSSCDEEDMEAMMISPDDVNRQFGGVCSGVESGSGGSDSDSESTSDSDSDSNDEDHSQETVDDEVAEDGASSLRTSNSLLAVGFLIVGAVL